MKQYGNVYVADEGNTWIRIEDGFDMGNIIDLGDNDSIENYQETPINSESAEK